MSKRNFMRLTLNDEWRKEEDAKDRQRELADAVRLAADAVLKAADAWEIAREDRGWHPTEYNFACGELEDAVRAHRKAKAEQAKERAT